jgi:CheY-like chemotaxis protein
MLVLLTDNASMNAKQTAKDAGFFEIFVKPIQPLALQIALTAAWEHWIELKNTEELIQ